MRDEVPRILSGHFCLIVVSAVDPPRIGLLPSEMSLTLRSDNVFVLTLTISTVSRKNFRAFLKLFSENFRRKVLTTIYCITYTGKNFYIPNKKSPQSLDSCGFQSFPAPKSLCNSTKFPLNSCELFRYSGLSYIMLYYMYNGAMPIRHSARVEAY